MRRSFTEILRQESPISLVREALWRTRKGWRSKRLLARIEDAYCPFSFRYLPYYRDGAPPALSKRSKALITVYADEIGRGRFPFLGYGTQNLSREPKWHVDFVSGFEWPTVPAKNHLSINLEGADIKAPWELSRLQFLPVIGKAYVITGDERYREDAKRLVLDWITKNPVGVGVNWSMAMEAALRAMSICFLLNLLSPLRPDEQNWLHVVTRCLWHHMLFIEAHTEFSHLISSNHYLSNVLGLYCLSEFLDGIEMPARRQKYRSRLQFEILRQVYQDGGDYEGSTGYHVLVTQMFTSALLLMRAANSRPEERFLDRLQRMYLMIQHLAGPLGQLPHVGDCDDGRVELLLDDIQQMLLLPADERNSLRVSNLLGIGKCLFGGDHSSAEHPSLEDAQWYGLEKSHHLDISNVARTKSPTQEVTVFPQSGMSVARMEQAEVLFFAVPNGIYGKGSHNHNDKLSFVLRLDGEELLCDPGTCTYTRDPEIRNRFRCTSAHNTLAIDGQEQNTIQDGRGGLFYLGTEAEVSRIEHAIEDQDLILRASHSGYKRFGITHTRTIRLRPMDNMAIVKDEIEGDGAHVFEINFQLVPGCKIISVENLQSQIQAHISGTRELRISFQGPKRLWAQREESIISRAYGVSRQAVRLRICGELTCPMTLTTIVNWTNDLCSPKDVKEASI